MFLKFVEEGTALRVQENAFSAKEPFICNAVFYRLEGDSMFWAGGLALYNYLEKMGENVHLSICFFRGAHMYTFTGEVKDMRMEGRIPLVLIKQISGITDSSRREYDRNEMRLNVRVYGVDPASLEGPNFLKANEWPDFSSDMFDISAGGMCLVSHDRLKCTSEPYALLEFSLGAKSDFLLPAKLVRKGDCPQTTLYKFDYGFEFDFIRAPEEKERLVMAIFNNKMAAFGMR